MRIRVNTIIDFPIMCIHRINNYAGAIIFGVIYSVFRLILYVFMVLPNSNINIYLILLATPHTMFASAIILESFEKLQ